MSGTPNEHRARPRAVPRDVVIWPDGRLETPCREVSAEALAILRAHELTKDVSPLRRLMDDMAATMVALGGGGLSAPQVGEDLRVICLRVQKVAESAGGPGGIPDGFDEIVWLINPSITILGSEMIQTREGCLSLPGVLVTVDRASYCRVSAWGQDGRPMEIGGDGHLAIALQHEIDHLDGRTLIDSCSTLRRDLVRRRLVKLKARGLHYKFPEVQ